VIIVNIAPPGVLHLKHLAAALRYFKQMWALNEMKIHQPPKQRAETEKDDGGHPQLAAW
jgi:hypothetical protein